MIICIKDIKDDKFVYNILPKMLYNKLVLECNSSITIKMNKYLNDNFGINIRYIVNMIKNNISVSKVSDKYYLAIDKNVIEPKSCIKLNSLVKLIDYGNLDVSGIQIVDKAFKFVRDNAREIYLVYWMKGGN